MKDESKTQVNNSFCIFKAPKITDDTTLFVCKNILLDESFVYKVNVFPLSKPQCMLKWVFSNCHVCDSHTVAINMDSP